MFLLKFLIPSLTQKTCISQNVKQPFTIHSTNLKHTIHFLWEQFLVTVYNMTVDMLKLQPVSSGWMTVTRPAWWKLQISSTFREHYVYKIYATMLPSGSTLHHSNMLFPEEGVCLLSTNSSCVQHILQSMENKWKIGNWDILNLDPYIHFPWHFPVMWMLDNCWEKLPDRLCVYTRFMHVGLHSCTADL